MCYTGMPSSLCIRGFASIPSQCSHAGSSAWHTILQLTLLRLPCLSWVSSPRETLPNCLVCRSCCYPFGTPVTYPTLEALCYLCWAQAQCQAGREGVKNVIISNSHRAIGSVLTDTSECPAFQAPGTGHMKLLCLL